MTRLDALKTVGMTRGNKVYFTGTNPNKFWFNLESAEFEHDGLSGPEFNSCTNLIEDKIDVELGDQPFSQVEQRPVAKKQCHYCGMPAKKIGFFDEPVCDECG